MICGVIVPHRAVSQDSCSGAGVKTASLLQESKEAARSALYGRKQLKGHEANFVFYYVLESVDPATAQMVVVVCSLPLCI
jgi:hypothetical protein